MSFEADYRDDDNIWWAVPPGDTQNAYDAAIEELERLRAAVARVRALAAEWMRNETRSAEYQDGLADAAEQVIAALDGPTPPR